MSTADEIYLEMDHLYEDQMDESYDWVCCICSSPHEKEYRGVCVRCDRAVCLDCGFKVGTELECEECFGGHYAAK